MYWVPTKLKINMITRQLFNEVVERMLRWIDWLIELSDWLNGAIEGIDGVMKWWRGLSDGRNGGNGVMEWNDGIEQWIDWSNGLNWVVKELTKNRLNEVMGCIGW